MPAPPSRRSFPWLPVLAGAIVVGVGWALVQGTANKPVAAPARGLPRTGDYHSLIVSPVDPRRILLGTHQGVYASTETAVASGASLRSPARMR